MSIAIRAAVPKLTSNQIRSFCAAWLGWALAGMDSFLYALVLVPSLVLPFGHETRGTAWQIDGTDA
jgi:hypothetical protein